jgi:hypothetical protein
MVISRGHARCGANFVVERAIAPLRSDLWQTVSVLGDRDTTCAMVGGIVACRVARGICQSGCHGANQSRIVTRRAESGGSSKHHLAGRIQTAESNSVRA